MIKKKFCEKCGFNTEHETSGFEQVDGFYGNTEEKCLECGDKK